MYKFFKDSRFSEVMLNLSLIYEMKLCEPLVHSWAKLLDQYSIEDIERAAIAYMSDTEQGHFKPKPSSLISFITGTRRNRAEIAAAVLVSATTLATARQGVSFSDPMINAAVAQTRGWVAAYYCIVNDQTSDDYLTEFKSAYERLSTSQSPHPAYLPGRIDDGTYVVIGNEADVERVVETGHDPKKPASATYSQSLQIL